MTRPSTKQKLSIANLIDNYFSSNDANILFNCTVNEIVNDCLTRRIDCFDEIINRKLDISKIVNKEKTNDCEMRDNQKVLMMQRMQYLRCAYHNLVECNINQRIKFSDCCKKGRKQMEMVGVRLINNYQIIMRWNRVFRQEEYFPHPNPYVENRIIGLTNQFYLNFFPHVKIEIT